MSQSETSPLEVRALGIEDLPAIQALFQSVFHHELSGAFHAWKYQEGQSGAIGVFRGERLVAHYAGIGADALMQGVPAKALQIVDVMVSVEARGAVRGHSPFFLAASSFLQRYIGYQQPFLLGYGFPSHRHMRLAQHLKLYAPVGSMTEMHIEPLGASRWSDVRFRWRKLDRADWNRHVDLTDGLWRDMRTELAAGIVICRDARRMAHRYAHHPVHEYQSWMVENRLTGKPLALVVLKHEAERILLMDIVAPLHRMRDILRLAAILASERFSLPLCAWFSSSYATTIAPAEARLTALPISIPANVWTDGPKPADLLDRWWLTAGDTDFL